MKSRKPKKYDGPTVVVPCPGAAHSNAFIDHCMICLHHSWGFITVPVGDPLAIAAAAVSA